MVSLRKKSKHKQPIKLLILGHPDSDKKSIYRHLLSKGTYNPENNLYGFVEERNTTIDFEGHSFVLINFDNEGILFDTSNIWQTAINNCQGIIYTFNGDITPDNNKSEFPEHLEYFTKYISLMNRIKPAMFIINQKLQNHSSKLIENIISWYGLNKIVLLTSYKINKFSDTIKSYNSILNWFIQNIRIRN